MKLQASHSVGFAALGAALALLSGHVAAASTIDTASTSMGCIPAFIGDGDCDINNNNTPDCGGKFGLNTCDDKGSSFLGGLAANTAVGTGPPWTRATVEVARFGCIVFWTIELHNTNWSGFHF